MLCFMEGVASKGIDTMHCHKSWPRAPWQAATFPAERMLGHVGGWVEPLLRIALAIVTTSRSRMTEVWDGQVVVVVIVKATHDLFEAQAGDGQSLEDGEREKRDGIIIFISAREVILLTSPLL